MKYFILVITITSLLTTATAQSETEGHFLVEFEKFSPPIQDLVMSFENKKAEPFMANDITGIEHFLGDYIGQKVLLWFWSIDNEQAKRQLGAMTLLQERNQDLKVIAFIEESRSKVEEFVSQNPIDRLTIIPNGEVFGQMAYGAELGSPRMFLIDDKGIIKAVLPQSAFRYPEKLVVNLESILGGM